MARVYQGERTQLDPLLRPVERWLYRAAGVRADEDMSWKTYAAAMLLFNIGGLVVVYLLQRAQAALPLNPPGLGAVTPDSSWNTAVSFASNTNWQGYGGEVTMSCNARYIPCCLVSHALGIPTGGFLIGLKHALIMAFFFTGVS